MQQGRRRKRRSREGKSVKVHKKRGSFLNEDYIILSLLNRLKKRYEAISLRPPPPTGILKKASNSENNRTSGTIANNSSNVKTSPK